MRGLATTYAAFLHHAFDREKKRFHNFLSFDRRWLDDRLARKIAMLVRYGHWVSRWAAPVIAVFKSWPDSFSRKRCRWFRSLLRPEPGRFSLAGIHEYLTRLSGDRGANQVREALTTKLMELFDRAAKPDWPWFEEELTYDNAKLAHALILSGRASGQTQVFERGLQALRWLVKVQTSEHGHLRPIGSNGFYRRGGTRANFDQQPIEAQAMVSACLEAYRATSDVWWYEQAQHAFDWFLGWNDLGLELYSSSTGGCRDALHVDRVNGNQGAESTLAFLLSLAEMQVMQNAVTVFNQPAK
jgi:hypothetical protein